MNTNINKLLKKLSKESIDIDETKKSKSIRNDVIFVTVQFIFFLLLSFVELFFISEISKKSIVNQICVCSVIQFLLGLNLLKDKKHTQHNSSLLINILSTNYIFAFFQFYQKDFRGALLIWFVSLVYCFLRIIRIKSINSHKSSNYEFLANEVSSFYLASFSLVFYDILIMEKIIYFVVFHCSLFLVVTSNLRNNDSSKSGRFSDFFDSLIKEINEGVFITFKSKIIYHNQFFVKLEKTAPIDYTFKRNNTLKFTGKFSNIDSLKPASPTVFYKNKSSKHVSRLGLYFIPEEKSSLNDGEKAKSKNFDQDESSKSDADYSLELKKRFKTSEFDFCNKLNKMNIDESDSLSVSDKDGNDFDETNIFVNSMKNLDIYISVNYVNEATIDKIFKQNKYGMDISSFIEFSCT